MHQARAYDQTMLLLAGPLVMGIVCNILVRPLPRQSEPAGPVSGAASTGNCPAATEMGDPWKQNQTALADSPAHTSSGTWLVVVLAAGCHAAGAGRLNGHAAGMDAARINWSGCHPWPSPRIGQLRLSTNKIIHKYPGHESQRRRHAAADVHRQSRVGDLP